MNPAEYDRMFENEDHYWWFRSRRELVCALVNDLKLNANAHILDVGCGTGATAAALRAFGTVAGIDFSPLALERCRRRGLTHLMQGAAESLPLQTGCVDLIVATDILEHLDDDEAALREFFRVLRPGGHAVISVPAYQMLWGEHDEALMHRRRYVAPVLGQRARAAGFRTVRLGYALCFLLPLALLRLARPRRAGDRPPEAQVWAVPRFVNEALVRFQRVETWLVRRMSLPWGLSVVAVLQKPLVSIPAPHVSARPVTRPGRQAAR